MTPPSPLSFVLGCACALAVAVASFMLWVAFDHNPRYEFYDPATGV